MSPDRRVVRVGRSAAATARAATRRRRELLLAEVRAGNGHDINSLAAQFGVSLSTVRRDLAALAGDGRIMRTYGGAVEPGHGREPSLRAKEHVHRADKDAIARCAAALVGPGDVLLLDAGTTVGRLAWHLRQREGITVVTNGLSALLALADAPGVEVIVLGGRLRRPNEAFLGPEVDLALRRYRPDLAFLGADGVEPTRGLSCPSPEQASVKELMAAAARQAWVLVDHSKLTTEPFAYWAAMPAGTGLVTDAGAPGEAVAGLDRCGWRVTTGGTTPPGERAGSCTLPTPWPREAGPGERSHDSQL
ncbi:DeoR/GlpR family DNA-binding transcription regulator [Pseudonocardia sp. RS11V-5]|uniref:DeoR/GlpR family DNA-binding transcription regulator n=1 Tax=Pseudonocardia terrae TaxID=2905831 RepID=UPI001E629177|nr:DeoR/GlpR family DNA-binding transcription regulator [Pseudonocardia terrae]MCE3550709.1 DeoR/GlpR family DNA-binding transcription regulator [Pseudonocardia terrae]